MRGGQQWVIFLECFCLSVCLSLTVLLSLAGGGLARGQPRKEEVAQVGDATGVLEARRD